MDTKTNTPRPRRAVLIAADGELIEIPEHTRLILASENLLDEWGTRNERGEKITVEWGEPSPEGWYTPTFTVHADDRLG